MTEGILASSPLPPSQLVDRALILPECTFVYTIRYTSSHVSVSIASNFIWATPVPNPNEPNSSLTYYLHIGSLTEPRLRVTSALLIQILTEPAFNVLRTQQQLGYIVSCSPWHLPGSGNAGVRIVVQSEKGPSYLDERVEAFLDDMKGVIEDMKEEVFEEQKTGLERKWREEAKNLNDETGRYWAHIDSGYLDFFRRERLNVFSLVWRAHYSNSVAYSTGENDADLLKLIAKHDVLSLFLSHVHPSSPTRSKLAVHMRSQKPRPKKLSVAATQEFERLLRAAGLGIDETQWREELPGDGTPIVGDFVTYWKSVLEQGAVAKEVTQELLMAIPPLLGKYSVEGEGDEKVREGATYIQDVKAFKASLKVSGEPRPLVEWGDLPISRF